MRFKTKLMTALVLVLVLFVTLLITSPRLIGWVFSYKKECKVLRVETFLKGNLISNLQQANKFSIICAEDGFICRAEDTGFAGIKAGDNIVFRGFPELSSLQEFGKCDHAQLLQFKPN